MNKLKYAYYVAISWMKGQDSDSYFMWLRKKFLKLHSFQGV